MRLVTRADFDGLVCGALVTKFEQIEDYVALGASSAHRHLTRAR